MDSRAHWENVYTTRASASLSWFQAPTRSLELIAQTKVPAGARIFDVGGGDSALVDGLVERGYANVALLDVSPSALERARNRLGRWLTRWTGSRPEREVHRTPGGAEQRFSYCLCRYEPASVTVR